MHRNRRNKRESKKRAGEGERKGRDQVDSVERKVERKSKRTEDEKKKERIKQ